MGRRKTKKGQKEIQYGPWEKPIIKQAVLSAVPLLPKHYFTEHLSTT